jgi:hypothetical protein
MFKIDIYEEFEESIYEKYFDSLYVIEKKDEKEGDIHENKPE